MEQFYLCLSSEREDLAVSPLRGLAAFAPWLCCKPLMGSTTPAGLRHTRCACPAGQPAAVTPLRSVYSLRLPFGPACGCYSAALRLLAALALRAIMRLLLRFAPFSRIACNSGLH